jgi:flavin-dependent dehydrogenase
MAAKTAAKNNLKTLLFDEKNEIGGSQFIKIQKTLKN